MCDNAKKWRVHNAVSVRIAPITCVDTDLFPEELQYARKFSATRRREFAAGRGLARRALEDIGVSSCAIPVDGIRRPVWPRGVRGSISHTRELVGAAVGSSVDIIGIGLDLESMNSSIDDLVGEVLTANELRRIGTDSLKRLVAFSCKEAVYKAVNPLTHEFLEFTDVEITVAEKYFNAKCVNRRKSSALISIGRGQYDFCDGAVRSVFIVSRK